jgi:hypothetical protein
LVSLSVYFGKSDRIYKRKRIIVFLRKKRNGSIFDYLKEMKYFWDLRANLKPESLKTNTTNNKLLGFI